MELIVNSAARTVRSSPLASLLTVLREELDITSPKAGCESGGCGACTVLVDGQPRRSCLTAVGVLDGAEVVTVEGLGTPENLSEVQRAFIHHYAAQCGFCSNGMVIAATAYIAGGGTGDVGAIGEALAGHFCRCTGYVKIIEAVAAVARGDSCDIDTTASSANNTYVTIAGGGS